MMPLGSMTKPDPSEVTLRGGPLLPCPFLSRKSLNSSSNGDPGGNSGIWSPSPDCCCNVWVVAMLTTAGESFSARSAKLTGAERVSWANDGADAASVTIKPKTAKRRTTPRAGEPTVDNLFNKGLLLGGKLIAPSIGAVSLD